MGYVVFVLKNVTDYSEGQRAYIKQSATRNNDRWPEINPELSNGDESFSFDDAVDRSKLKL